MNTIKVVYHAVFQLLIETGKIWLFIGLHNRSETFLEKMTIAFFALVNCTLSSQATMTGFALLGLNSIKKHIFSLLRITEPRISKDLESEQELIDKSGDKVADGALATMILMWGNFALIWMSILALIFLAWPNLLGFVPFLAWLG